MTQQRDNSGILFRNDRKETERHPDYTGSATINGVELRLSAWIKTSAKGTKFMSLAFSEPRGDAREKPAQSTDAAPKSAGGGKDLDDDIPFNCPRD